MDLYISWHITSEYNTVYTLNETLKGRGEYAYVNMSVKKRFVIIRDEASL